MAKGYPDFFGQSIFPHYGAINREAQGAALVGNASTVMLTLTLKGTVVACEFGFFPSTTGVLSTKSFSFSVDGTTFLNLTGESFADPFYVKSLHGIARIKELTRSDRSYRAELNIPVNFANTFIITVANTQAGETTTFYGTAYYYHVA